MGLAVAAANTAWMLGNMPAALRFHRALRRPRAAQCRILQCYLRDQAETAFGRAHGFSKIRTPEEFQRRVPVSTYESYGPYIERIAGGEAHVLTRDPVRRFALSSGSTRAEKWIPYTALLVAEFGKAIAPWADGLFRAFPALRGGPAYWSITPVGKPPQRASAVPVGFDEDSAYLGGLFKRVVDATFAAPAELRHVESMDSFRYLTLLCLLRTRELRLISVWHPSFFTLLLDAAQPVWESLLEDIRHGTCHPPGNIPPNILHTMRRQPNARRADELRACGPNRCNAFWPRLAVISCWADAHAAGPGALAALFPYAAMQPKGLLLTEGVVTLPLTAAGKTLHPLAVRSHFFEFLPETGAPLLAADVDVGGTYSVLLTTAGGLYRYQTGDRVRIAGRYCQAPCLEFLGKSDHISDRFGEKLNTFFVAEILAQLQRLAAHTFEFGMLAPDGAGYTLFAQAKAKPSPALATMLDELLARNPHYAYCRALGQLARARVFHVASKGHAAYLERCRRDGQRLGNIKPTPLHLGEGWAHVFDGDYL